MKKLNVEIKTRCRDLDEIRSILQELNAQHVGIDHQVDTYFKVPSGRLKLREGTIERALIFYKRPDQSGPKRSDVLLYPTGKETDSLKQILTRVHGVLIVVDKQRDIWFVENVKVHLDEVAGLGQFLEIEAIDDDGSIGEDTLRDQCTRLMQRFHVRQEDLIDRSYSDLLLEL